MTWSQEARTYQPRARRVNRWTSYRPVGKVPPGLTWSVTDRTTWAYDEHSDECAEPGRPRYRRVTAVHPGTGRPAVTLWRLHEAVTGHDAVALAVEQGHPLHAYGSQDDDHAGPVDVDVALSLPVARLYVWRAL